MPEDNRKTVSTIACCANNNINIYYKLDDEEKLGALKSHSLQIALSPGRG